MSLADRSALSSKLLARRTAGTIALIGAREHARSLLPALQSVHRLTHVVVWDPSAVERERFAADFASADAVVKAVDHPGEAIIGADLIVLTAASSTPLIEDGWVKPGAHIIAMSVPGMTGAEMDPALIARARVFDDVQLEGIVGGAEGRRGRAEITMFRAGAL